ncbi:MAG: hypothetical protein U5K71_08695 [Gracilimonas sp.]|nr:hypothetical protein [Gracilimonas sp.]
MGRAMLIIAAGAIIAVGILQLGVQSKRTGIAQNSAVDAYEVEVRNKAFTAAQLTMERINASSGTWHPTANSPWKQEIDGTPISLYYELKPTTATGTFAMLEGDTVEIHATAEYLDPLSDQKRDINIITNYVKTSMHFVPEFKGALQFAVGADDFNFSIGGAAGISGNDASGTSCPSKPAVVDTRAGDRTIMVNFRWLMNKWLQIVATLQQLVLTLTFHISQLINLLPGLHR